MQSDGPLLSSEQVVMAASHPLVLVLCGNCGVGKSSTANTLCGGSRFTARRSAAAVTMQCHAAEVTTLDGRLVVVLDTPGLSDPEAADGETVHAHIITSVAQVADSNPDARFAIGLVASVAGRLDDAALEAFLGLGLVFGRNIFEHALILWTHGDLLLERVDGGVQHSGPRDGNPQEVGTGAEMASALDAYLSDTGERVSGWLAKVRGGSLVIDNHGQHPLGVELMRVADRAFAVSCPASRIAPPKPHRKVARRERQRAIHAAIRRERGLSGEDTLARLLACAWPCVNISGEQRSGGLGGDRQQQLRYEDACMGRGVACDTSAAHLLAHGHGGPADDCD